MNKTVPQTEQKTREMCDLIVSRAAEMMSTEAGAPVEMIMDRFVTYVAAQTVATFGKQEALNMLRHAAKTVEQGAFDHLDPARSVN